MMSTLLALVAAVVLCNLDLAASQTTCTAPVCPTSASNSSVSDQYCAGLAVFFDCAYNGKSSSSNTYTCSGVDSQCLKVQASCPDAFRKCGCNSDYCDASIVYPHFGYCGGSDSNSRRCRSSNSDTDGEKVGCGCNRDEDSYYDRTLQKSVQYCSSDDSGTGQMSVRAHISLHCGDLKFKLSKQELAGIAAGASIFALMLGSVVGLASGYSLGKKAKTNGSVPAQQQSGTYYPSQSQTLQNSAFDHAGSNDDAADPNQPLMPNVQGEADANTYGSTTNGPVTAGANT